MSITSYAQNFEDVMLWRALKHIPNGYYIDVGAQHPIVDSVSKAFYELGWRGVHVEATPAYASLLRQDRPDETVIQAAVSDIYGDITFFEIPETGISTGDADIAKNHKAIGFDVFEITVPCITLMDVFKYADSKNIHWLKIDVEGMERSVLQSWGQSKARPWIVIVESTLPLTQIENHQIWESQLLDRGYVHVYFDGLNRFYLSPDQPQLASAFLSGPNVFDGFTLHGTASSPFCAAVNEKHRQSEQALQQQVALLNREKTDSLQHFDAALAEISTQLRAAQEEEQKTKAGIAEDFIKRAAQERKWQAELEALHANQRLAAEESARREQVIAEKLELVKVKAVDASTELAHALAQDRHALKNQHANREQILLKRLETEQEKIRQLQLETSTHVHTLHTQGSLNQQKIEDILRAQLKREQVITETLEAVRNQAAEKSTELLRIHVAQQSDLLHQYGANEKLLQQKIEAEQAQRWQLQHDNSVREKNLHEQVRLAQQSTENLLKTQLQRERGAAAQLLALQQKSTQENTELSRALATQQTESHSKHIRHAQALHEQAQNAQQEIDKLLREHMQRERELTGRLLESQQNATRENSEQTRDFLLQERALQCKYSDQHAQLTGQLKEANSEIDRLLEHQAVRESQHAAIKDELNTKFDSVLGTHLQRERELAAQLLKNLQQAATIKEEEEALKHTEQQRDLRLQLAQLTDLSKSEVRKLNVELAEREYEWAVNRSSLINDIKALRAAAQALKQLNDQTQQQHSDTLSFERTKHASLLEAWLALETQLREEITLERSTSLRLNQTIAEIRLSLAATRATLTWRATAPLRKLASLLNFRAPPKLNSDPAMTDQPSDFLEHTRSAQNFTAHAETTSITAQSTQNRTHMSLPEKTTPPTSNTVASTLPDLLARYDQDFIECAYRTLLGRAPDQEGFNYYLNRLRSGVPKMRTVMQLCESGEGKNYAAQLSGLGIAVAQFRRREKPLLGWFWRQLEQRDSANSIEYQLCALQNQLSLLSNSTTQRFNQIDLALVLMQESIAQQSQSTTTAQVELPANALTRAAYVSGRATLPDGVRQLSPRGRTIFLQLKTAVAIYGRKTA